MESEASPKPLNIGNPDYDMILLAYCSFVFLALTLILFIPLLSTLSESGNYILIILGTLCIIENLLFGDIRNSLIRELLGTTYIEIQTTKHIEIKSYKFSISKKLWFMWQLDLSIQKKYKEIPDKLNGMESLEQLKEQGLKDKQLSNRLRLATTRVKDVERERIWAIAPFQI